MIVPAMVAAAQGAGKRRAAGWYTASHFWKDFLRMQILCAFDELEENASKGFSVRLEGAEREIFVVRRDGQVYGYQNICPHRGTNLDWMPDQFMDPDREFIQCATHDARFQVEDGMCVVGPCLGQSLTPATVQVVDGQVVLGTSPQGL
jgi:nitrite reductase/ring-hydroxylating ferredoxin subunit